MRTEALTRAQRLARGLFPHQIEGVAFLLGRRRSILADDMGLGKTRQSIVAVTEAAPRGPWLVVMPASVKRNWAREILAALPGERVQVVGLEGPPEPGYEGWVVVNYDLLGRHLEAFEPLPWTALVFDEAHYLKNHTSQRSRFARRLVESAPDAVLHALTGTPLTNRPRDLFPLLQLVGHPMGRSFLSFAKRYCAAHHNGYGWVTDGARALDELRTQLHGIMLRRTKEGVLDLPPKLRSWVPVQVPEGTGRRETRRVLETLLAGALERARGDVTASPALGSRRGVAQDRGRLLAQLNRARLAIAHAKVSTTIEFLEGALTTRTSTAALPRAPPRLDDVGPAAAIPVFIQSIAEGQSMTIPGASGISAEQLEFLRGVDSPTIANAIEQMQTRDRCDGYIGGSIRCMFPELGVLVGHALTVTMDNSPGPVADREGIWRMWEALLTMPRPSVLVVQDLSGAPTRCAYFGEVMATIATACGAVALVTDGGVRDLDEVRAIGLRYFAPHPVVSHGNYRVVDVGLPVTLDGQRVETGDLLHGDLNGIVIVPRECLGDLPAAVDRVRRRERRIIEYARAGAEFSLEGLRDIGGY